MKSSLRKIPCDFILGEIVTVWLSSAATDFSLQISFIHWPYTKSKLHWYLAFWDAPDLSPFWSLDFLYTAFPEWWQLFILIPADFLLIFPESHGWSTPVTSMINIIYICREQHWTTSGSCLRVVVSTDLFHFGSPTRSVRKKSSQAVEFDHLLHLPSDAEDAQWVIQ